MPFYSFLGEGSPNKIDYRKKGTLILTSLQEDLVGPTFGFQNVQTESWLKLQASVVWFVQNWQVKQFSPLQRTVLSPSALSPWGGRATEWGTHTHLTSCFVKPLAMFCWLAWVQSKVNSTHDGLGKEQTGNFQNSGWDGNPTSPP